jgi:CRP/FNR family transcriptional regulator
MTAALTDRVVDSLSSLADLPPLLREEVGRTTTVIKLAAGSPLFKPRVGGPGFPGVLSGRVRVSRTLDSGRELVLYDVSPGESCVLSTGCLLGHSPYGAQGMCMTDVELALIPKPVFDRLLAEHAPFRADVFGVFSERLSRLMELVEEVGFQRLDQRLAGALLGKGQRLQASHEQLARELGVSRESVSRQLKHFEERGWVQLGRGALDILDPRALRQLAAAGSVSPVTETEKARG